MSRPARLSVIALIISGLFCSCAQESTLAGQDQSTDLFSKKEVVIAVTDSGLGGLSVTAAAAARMRVRGPFRKVDFIYYNALFSNVGGYNSLPTREAKIRIFNSALEGLQRSFSPDAVIIACNTLSVLYEETEFSRNAAVPVVGIVDAGVELISENLKSRPDSKVILFGTQTTVEEDAHRSRLVKRGFLPERIITQACPDLVPYIERGFDSTETEMLLFAYADEALRKVGNGKTPLFISFNCTHYGYSLDLWKTAFAGLEIEPLGFLNPNPRLTDFLFPPGKAARFEQPQVTVRVVSMVEIDRQRRDSIGRWLARISPETAAALKDYERRSDLFEWKSLVNRPPPGTPARSAER